MKKPRGFWLKQSNIEEEARKYKSRKEFMIGNKHAYYQALKLKLMDSLFCKNDSKVKVWTRERLFAYASSYSNMGEIYNSNKYVWELLRAKGYHKELFPNEKQGRRNLLDCEIIDLCKGYTSIGELQKADSSVYNMVRRRGIESSAFAHMKNNGCNKDRQVYIIKNDLYVYVGSTSNRKSRLSQHLRNRKMVSTFGNDLVYSWLSKMMESKSALKLESDLISKFTNDGFKILNKNMGNAAGTKIVKWTREKIFQESKKYTSFKEMRMKNNSLRCAIIRNGMYDEIKRLLNSI